MGSQDRMVMMRGAWTKTPDTVDFTEAKGGGTMKIVVSGGTGFIGRALVAELCGAGHQVVVLARKPGSPSFPNEQRVEWNARSAGPWRQHLRDAQAVVNLAGEPIAEKRWTSARKRQLLDSRLSATRCLVDGLMAEATRPPVLISASGIGYYGVGGARALGEEAPLGQGFLADLSARWEAEAQRAAQAGARVVLLRIGMVLERDGGALAKMLLPFRLYAGGPVLPGTQWVSWIHRQDLIGLILWALATPSVAGPVNAVAPEAVTMKTFCEVLGRVLHRPSWLPVPELALKVALGELGTLLTTGQRVEPTKAQAGGYQFVYPTLEAALQAIVHGPSRTEAA